MTRDAPCDVLIKGRDAAFFAERLPRAVPGLRCHAATDAAEALAKAAPAQILLIRTDEIFPELIDAMQKPDFDPQPKARLVITAADLATPGTQRKTVRYDLPDQVKVSPDDQKKMVEFKVVERAATATP